MTVDKAASPPCVQPGGAAGIKGANKKRISCWLEWSGISSHDRFSLATPDATLFDLASILSPRYIR